jgi:CHAT domain-containing protein
MRTTVVIVVLLALGLSAGAADKPEELTPQRRQELEKKARDLDDEVVRLCRRGDFPAATEVLREVLTLRRKAYPQETYLDGQPDLAMTLNNLGRLLQWQGDHARAEPFFRQSLAMRQRLYPKEKYPDGHAEIAQSLTGLGELYRLQGEYARAEPFFADALSMYQRLYPREKFPGGHPQLAAGLGNWGVLLQSQGDYAAAEVALRAALEMDRQLYPASEYPDGHAELAASLYNLGVALQAYGEFAQAERFLRDALDMYRRLYPVTQFPNGHFRIAVALNNLAFVMRSQREYAKAESLARDALAVHRKLFPADKYPNGHPDLAVCLTSVGDLCKLSAKLSEAERFYTDALTMYGKLYPRARYPNGHLNLAITLNNLGYLRQDVGDPAGAERFFRDALDMVRKLFPPELYPDGHPRLAVCLNNLGFLRLEQGEYAKGEVLFRDALGMCQTLLGNYAAVASEVESRNLLESLPPARDALLSAQRHLPASPSDYDLLWPSRAALMRVMEGRHRDLVASRDDKARQLGRELVEARQRLAHALLNPAKDAREHRRLIEKLTREKEDLEKLLARELRLAPRRADTADLTPKRLRDLLSEGTAFVDVFKYTDFEQDPKLPGRKGAKHTPRYLAFVLRNDEAPVRVDLKEAATIEDAWAAWHKAITADRSDPKGEREAAARFAELVWRPLRTALPADIKTVYIAAEGKLAQVPWAALPGRGPDSVLLDEMPICLVPHGPFLLERLEEKAPPSSARDTLLAYGGIDYAGTPEAVVKGNLRTPPLGKKRVVWPALPGTEREQRQVAELARKVLRDPPIARTGRAASTAQLMEDLPGARYLHLATHGFFADAEFHSAMQVDPSLFEYRGVLDRRGGARSPLVLSGLVLAGANREGKAAAPDRGIITAEGLIGLRLEGLELAVLSACETGLGEDGGGEGVYGLQRAFHVAGCQSVIASLWKVDDAATQALMTLFYRNLWEKKLDAAEALRQAQLTLYRHPETVQVVARRGLDFTESDLPKVEEKPAEKRPHSPTAHWAAFTFSGVRPGKNVERK